MKRKGSPRYPTPIAETTGPSDACGATIARARRTPVRLRATRRAAVSRGYRAVRASNGVVSDGRDQASLNHSVKARANLSSRRPTHAVRTVEALRSVGDR